MLGSQAAAVICEAVEARTLTPRFSWHTAACGAVARPLVDFCLVRPDADVHMRIFSALLFRPLRCEMFPFVSFERAPPPGAVAGDRFGGLQPAWGACAKAQMGRPQGAIPVRV